ncbi:hypothetical protein [Clostridium sardiniense]|uniref:hypothetical protein n=1 Tax=Clostridium sardiniense TaxID=29369 RepID=UPI003D336AF2
MNKKEIIIKEYKYLIKIKKIIMILGIISSMSLLFTVYIRKISTVLTILGCGITICTLILFCLLWISIPYIKKHILKLTENC